MLIALCAKEVVPRNHLTCSLGKVLTLVPHKRARGPLLKCSREREQRNKYSNGLGRFISVEDVKIEFQRLVFFFYFDLF